MSTRHGLAVAPVPLRQLSRLTEIITILWSSGFGWLVEAAGLRGCVSPGCRLICATGLRDCPHRIADQVSGPERLVAALERHGPTYVKMVESELRRPIAELFAEFVDEPFAAASLSQVHRARLLGGTEVAVKVQRPDARRQVDADLELLALMAKRLERRRGTSLGFQPTAVVEEFATYTHRELD